MFLSTIRRGFPWAALILSIGCSDETTDNPSGTASGGQTSATSAPSTPDNASSASSGSMSGGPSGPTLGRAGASGDNGGVSDGTGGGAGSGGTAAASDDTSNGGTPPVGDAAGSGGVPVNAGGTAGVGALGGNGGVSQSSGGTNTGGDPSAGGAGGAGFAGNAGLGGNGAGGEDAGGADAAAELDGFRFECPCLAGDENHTGDDNCNVAPETDRQTIVKTMGGDPNTVYDVTFRVRGLTEPNTYVNGMLEGDRFYIGGTTSASGYTSYMMTVADPPQHYFFNYNPTTGHVHFLLDYEVTISIRGGSQVTLDVDGDGSVPDGHQVSNFDEMVVPDVPPAPEWYDGQFVQLDVLSVDAAQ